MRFWQWLILGLLVGGGVAAYRIYAADALLDREVSGVSLSQERFERSLLSRFDDGQRFMQDIVVHPRVRPFVHGKLVSHYVVSCLLPYEENIIKWKMAQSGGRMKVQLVRVNFAVPQPYVPGSHLGSVVRNAGPQTSIIDILNQVRQHDVDQKLGDPLTFRYAWTKTPPAIIGFWGGGAFVVVGLIFPLVLKLTRRGRQIPAADTAGH